MTKNIEKIMALLEEQKSEFNLETATIIDELVKLQPQSKDNLIKCIINKIIEIIDNTKNKLSDEMINLEGDAFAKATSIDVSLSNIRAECAVQLLEMNIATIQQEANKLTKVTSGMENAIDDIKRIVKKVEIAVTVVKNLVKIAEKAADLML